jgi:hypothetical protein
MIVRAAPACIRSAIRTRVGGDGAGVGVEPRKWTYRGRLDAGCFAACGAACWLSTGCTIGCVIRGCCTGATGLATGRLDTAAAAVFGALSPRRPLGFCSFRTLRALGSPVPLTSAWARGGSVDRGGIAWADCGWASAAGGAICWGGGAATAAAAAAAAAAARFVASAFCDALAISAKVALFAVLA